MPPEAPGRDFLAECEALEALVAPLDDRQFLRRTAFHGWTTRDEVMHLHFLDVLTMMAIEEEEAFVSEVASIRRWQAAGVELSDLMRDRYRHFDRPGLLAAWRDGFHRLAGLFAVCDPARRMKWFGPDMSLSSAAGARQMEVWAHGQDIYDLFNVTRVNADRIRNICELGVRTYGWTFRNRKMEPPGPLPAVELTGPSGARWRWGGEGSTDIVSGPAADFAAVVTRRRHVDDTELVATGPAARQWMELAQCFAGPPADPPPRTPVPDAYPQALHPIKVSHA